MGCQLARLSFSGLPRLPHRQQLSFRTRASHFTSFIWIIRPHPTAISGCPSCCLLLRGAARREPRTFLLEAGKNLYGVRGASFLAAHPEAGDGPSREAVGSGAQTGQCCLQAPMGDGWPGGGAGACFLMQLLSSYGTADTCVML